MEEKIAKGERKLSHDVTWQIGRNIGCAKVK